MTKTGRVKVGVAVGVIGFGAFAVGALSALYVIRPALELMAESGFLLMKSHLE